MYINEKKQVMSLLDTVLEMITFLQSNKQIDVGFIDDCKTAMKCIENMVQSTLSPDKLKYFQEIEKYWEALIIGSQLSDDLEEINKKTIFIRNQVALIKPRWRMYFLPYKASMWTAMESVWQQAFDDPNCDAVVMPIPYYTGDALGELKEHYEIDQFPSYVPVVDHKSINLQDVYPETIFIHNPYDNTNLLTSVPEKYYSKNLLDCTNQLVYISYFTFQTSGDEHTQLLMSLPALKYCDYVIVESDNIKNSMVKLGHNPEKILALGSPKLDAIVNMKEPQPIPEEWVRKLGNRKVLLYTFSLAVIADAYYLTQIKKCMQEYWRDSDLGFIFRPHPLAKEWAARSGFEHKKIVDEIYELAENQERFVLDLNPDYRLSFYRADGLFLTDATSLTNEFLLTGKPIYWDKLDADSNQESLIYHSKMPLDLTHLYCPHTLEWDIYCDADVQVVNWHYKGTDAFFDVIKTGVDPKMEDRIAMVKNAFNNADGTCGEKTYKVLVEKLQNI